MTSESGDREFTAAMESTRASVNARLEEIVAGQVSAPANIRDALAYTVLNGGKRLRPILCLWTHDALEGGRGAACLDVACALECLHTYSLVHDDLPCMDNDDMRRGRPSCHKTFGEAVAVLTGDALLTLCFEIVSDLGVHPGVEPRLIVDTARVITAAAGTRGLITGQALDLESDSAPRDLTGVDRIHAHKTGALLSACMAAGAIVAGANPASISRVQRAGTLAGLAFQIIDDVLDIEGDDQALGKTAGKDARTGKLTYPSVAGVAASRRRAAELIEEAKVELGAPARGTLLGKLLDRMAARSR
jgi:geranylgeranyl diphosphate synthase type II